MTITLAVPDQGRSKKALLELLEADPGKVTFVNPALPQFIAPGDFRQPRFTGADIPLGASFPICMDPKSRRRFSIVRRTSSGTWRVE